MLMYALWVYDSISECCAMTFLLEVMVLCHLFPSVGSSQLGVVANCLYD